MCKELAVAQVCQYVVATISAATRPIADEREAGDLAVHARSALARLETSRRPPSSTKFATTLEPP